MGRNRIREEKLVLRVSPAGRGQEPSRWFQGYYQNSVPQKQPALYQRNPLAGKRCEAGSLRLVGHHP